MRCANDLPGRRPFLRARIFTLTGFSLIAVTACCLVGPDEETILYDAPFPMEMSRPALVELIQATSGSASVEMTPPDTTATFAIRLESCRPWSTLWALTLIEAVDDTSSVLRLREIRHQCGESADSLAFLQAFEDQVVDGLRGDSTVAP